jgi:quercetin dioxygenase-like cupin family protein
LIVGRAGVVAGDVQAQGGRQLGQRPVDQPGVTQCEVTITAATSRGGQPLLDQVEQDLFGPTVEFLTSPDDAHGDFCVLRGVVPPGAVIPLNSPDDTETFFVVAGTQQVLLPGADGLEWSDAHAGDYVQVPGSTPHAHRNVFHDPAIDLIVTTARLGKFFQEVGRPVTGPLQSPTPDEVARFAAVAAATRDRSGG